MKIGVIIFSDNDCGRNLLHAFNNVMEVSVAAIWFEDDIELCDFDLLVFSGGMDWYGHYLSTNPKQMHPMLQKLTRISSAKNTILAIGEGFRLFCELGLLPGKFIKNVTGHFLNRNVYVRIDATNRLITRGLNHNTPFILPVASLFGQYTVEDQELAKMRQQDQILFRYCDALGTLSEEVNFAGSKDNIAGVCNDKGNILGILPNIDRAVDEMCGNISGRILLKMVLKNMEV